MLGGTHQYFLHKEQYLSIKVHNVVVEERDALDSTLWLRISSKK